MYFEFANVLVFILVACGFILGSMVMGRIIRRQRPDPEKLTTYECGEDTIGTAWVQFNVRFYIIALIFLIFDVEIAVLFPWTTVFAEAKAMGPLAFIEMSLFLVILLVGFAYVWVKGDLEWLTSLGEVKKSSREEGT
jgi:NADH-quinone oxidoreductase subunit A